MPCLGTSMELIPVSSATRPVGMGGTVLAFCPQPSCWLFAGGVSIGNVLPAADIAQFKQGVKSVAGKMAVLANGVMNSLQVRKGDSGLGVDLDMSFLPNCTSSGELQSK